jgi:metallopeptidase family M12-like protein
MTVSGTTSTSMSDNLDIFSLYWKNNHPAGSPTRAFAIMLSGLEPSTANSCSASGIAWLNKYCAVGTTSNGHTSGSYSVNQVCTSTNPFFGPTFSALLVGHELGHNFGAQHTHCTDTTTGAAQVATNTIDVCYNGEGAAFGGSCYNGAESCPASGPGAPAGTIMSYCNFSSCGPDGQNVLQFHPTHITKVLLPAITTAVTANATCLNTTDDVFFSGFD